uniref:rRNA-processing protein FYV7 n=1 Tax=Tetraselmis chuii TaxID=63592 RepID=A0A7S1SV61_9CHLO|mmetsp:Transcript_30881/g.55284  ORF Transcript_30881/g.55284 Transcript_30881/m.55284 type:complete len:179 (+) Transcript_30881:214-750(+)
MVKGHPPVVGAGLGLDRFASAKKSTYDKRAVKAKQTALNAKKVNKYRKLLRKMEPGSTQTVSTERSTDNDGGKDTDKWGEKEASAGKGGKTQGRSGAEAVAKRKNQLQRLAEKVEVERRSEAAEHEQERKTKEEVALKKAESQKQRRKEKSKFFKKTRQGQPVMKYRVEKILSQLQSK